MAVSPGLPIWATGTWGAIWQTGVWQSQSSDISPGDLVQVIHHGGIECQIVHSASGTPVRVVHASSKQITVLHASATLLRVTICAVLLFASSAFAAEPPPRTDAEINREIGRLEMQRDQLIEQIKQIIAMIQERENELKQKK